MKMKRKRWKKGTKWTKNDIINKNIINDNTKEENDEEDHMENKLKILEKIIKERRILKENIFKENKKIPLLGSIKINNKITIPNSQNLNKISIFPQISNDQPRQPISNHNKYYYDLLMQQAVFDYHTESQIMAFQPKEFVNINLLRKIANIISEDSSKSILSRLILLILLICLYGWLTYDFNNANGFTLRATTDLFCLATEAFIVLCGLIIQHI